MFLRIHLHSFPTTPSIPLVCCFDLSRQQQKSSYTRRGWLCFWLLALGVVVGAQIWDCFRQRPGFVAVGSRDCEYCTFVGGPRNNRWCYRMKSHRSLGRRPHIYFGRSTSLPITLSQEKSRRQQLPHARRLAVVEEKNKEEPAVPNIYLDKGAWGAF